MPLALAQQDLIPEKNFLTHKSIQELLEDKWRILPELMAIPELNNLMAPLQNALFLYVHSTLTRREALDGIVNTIVRSEFEGKKELERAKAGDISIAHSLTLFLLKIANIKKKCIAKIKENEENHLLTRSIKTINKKFVELYRDLDITNGAAIKDFKNKQDKWLALLQLIYKAQEVGGVASETMLAAYKAFKKTHLLKNLRYHYCSVEDLLTQGLNGWNPAEKCIVAPPMVPGAFLAEMQELMTSLHNNTNYKKLNDSWIEVKYVMKKYRGKALIEELEKEEASEEIKSNQAYHKLLHGLINSIKYQEVQTLPQPTHHNIQPQEVIRLIPQPKLVVVPVTPAPPPIVRQMNLAPSMGNGPSSPQDDFEQIEMPDFFSSKHNGMSKK